MANAEYIKGALIGKVVSDKMQKTIVVEVERTVKHRQYGKILRQKSKYQAHDEHEQCKIGDNVRICQTRPISKNKAWTLVEVIA